LAENNETKKSIKETIAMLTMLGVNCQFLPAGYMRVAGRAFAVIVDPFLTFGFPI
jgi:hypothetical protein